MNTSIVKAIGLIRKVGGYVAMLRLMCLHHQWLRLTCVFRAEDAFECNFLRCYCSEISPDAI